MSNNPVTVPSPVLAAYRAAESKKSIDLKVLDLQGISSFTDYFLICSGTNTRQNQAISNEIEEQLAKLGEKPFSTEGYDTANWILMDYGDFVIHIFQEDTRKFYDLERLWGMAQELPVPEETPARA